jgi:TPR repeat protein
MRSYQILRDETLHPRTEAVKIGFNYPAFFFTWIWALVKGLWGPAVLAFLVSLLVAGVFIVGPLVEAVIHSRTLLMMAYRLSLQREQRAVLGLVAAALLLALQAFFGYRGNRLVRARLERQGFRPAAPIVPARSKAQATAVWSRRRENETGNLDERAETPPRGLWWRGSALVTVFTVLLLGNGARVFLSSPREAGPPPPLELMGRLIGPQADMHALRHCRVAKECAVALRDLRAYVHRAYPYAESRWATILLKGRYGVARNIARAIHWYRVSAAGGDAYGLYTLGRLAAAHRIPGGMREARVWFTLAARQGNLDAVKDLGYWPWRIDAMLATRSKSEFLALRVAARRGNPVAEYYYGRVLQSNRADRPSYDPRSVRRAVFWYRRSARQGFWYAEYDMGQAYLSGWVELPRDMKKADHWWRLAALQGEDLAANNLGYSYETGTGVPRSRFKAVAWFLASNVDGYHPALAKAESLMRTMSGREMEEVYEYLVHLEAPLRPIGRMRLRVDKISESAGKARHYRSA